MNLIVILPTHELMVNYRINEIYWFHNINDINHKTPFCIITIIVKSHVVKLCHMVILGEK